MNSNDNYNIQNKNKQVRNFHKLIHWNVIMLHNWLYLRMKLIN